MPDDNAIKSMLERLCCLQEQQLAKRSEALERAAAARERLEKAADAWKTPLRNLKRRRRHRPASSSYQIGAWLQTALILFMLGVIAIAIIVSHYLK